jgi:hypothetical protein
LFFFFKEKIRLGDWLLNIFPEDIKLQLPIRIQKIQLEVKKIFWKKFELASGFEVEIRPFFLFK